MTKNLNTGNEDRVTKEIESQTAKIPSTIFLVAALASMGTALTFKIMKNNKNALFFGQWAAPFLLLGIYNKIVKTHGHDKADQTI